MLTYKPATTREQKILNHINKPITDKEQYNSELHITGEDLILMLISSTIFALIIVFLV
jgi:hypothetical protein